MVGRELDTGPTARTVAENVKRLRSDRGLNYTELSELLQEAAGWTVNAVGIRRIESGERRVTPDDLVALAVALGVSPPTLLMPAINHSDEKPIEANVLIAATGFSEPIAAQTFWEWLIASQPIGDNSNDAMFAFTKQAWPVWFQRTWNQRLRATHKEMMEDLYRTVPGGDMDGGLDLTEEEFAEFLRAARS